MLEEYQLHKIIDSAWTYQLNLPNTEVLIHIIEVRILSLSHKLSKNKHTYCPRQTERINYYNFFRNSSEQSDDLNKLTNNVYQNQWSDTANSKQNIKVLGFVDFPVAKGSHIFNQTKVIKENLNLIIT